MPRWEPELTDEDIAYNDYAEQEAWSAMHEAYYDKILDKEDLLWLMEQV